MNDFVIEPVSSAHTAALAALFERTGTPCYCRYFHFEGDKNAWLDRCANQTARSRAEMVAALDRGDDTMRGFVARAAEHVVGWMKLTPASSVAKLYAQRLYRGLPCFDGDRDGVHAIGCFLVDEPWRRHGVARALLRFAIDRARSSGARAIEAFPRRADGVPDAQLWTGPLELFLAEGFAEVHSETPYPVLRLDLA